MTKIIFLSPHLKIAGGVRVILTYAKLLAAKQVVWVVVENKIFWRRFLANLLNFEPKWFRPVRARIIRVGNVLKTLESEEGVIVASSWKSAAILSSTYLPKEKLFYLIQHDERLYHGEPAKVAKTYQSGLRKIVVSTWLKEMLKRDFNQDSELILNSFDRELFHPVGEAKVSDGKVRVLVLDHPYKWKGTAEGVKMVNELKIKYPNLVLMGLGARRDEKPEGFDEFYFSPAQGKLAEIYSRADIFLCPSWDEGFGLPSLEAMACGTAVVTYDNGGSRDFAHDGETALVSPRRDEQSLKNNLERLIVDKELRQKIAANGLRLAQNWPTWEEQAKKLEQILFSGL